MKCYSNLSNTNIDYYPKERIAIMHRKILQKISQNPESVKQFRNDRINAFHFTIREWTNCM